MLAGLNLWVALKSYNEFFQCSACIGVAVEEKVLIYLNRMIWLDFRTGIGVFAQGCATRTRKEWLQKKVTRRREVRWHASSRSFCRGRGVRRYAFGGERQNLKLLWSSILIACDRMPILLWYRILPTYDNIFGFVHSVSFSAFHFVYRLIRERSSQEHSPTSNEHALRCQISHRKEKHY